MYYLLNNAPAGAPSVTMLSSEPVTGATGVGAIWVNFADSSRWVVSRNSQGMGYLTQGTVPRDDFVAAAPPPPSGGTPVTGSTYHYNDGHTIYAITVQSIGTGWAGLTTVEGINLPIGTVYQDLVDWSIWKVTGSNSATQVTGNTPPATTPPADTGSDLVEHISVDPAGTLTWKFDPSAPSPHELFYDQDGNGNWQALGTGDSGTASLAFLPPGHAFDLVMHAGGSEVARYVYHSPTATTPASIVPASLSGIPTWALLVGALLIGWFVFGKR